MDRPSEIYPGSAEGGAGSAHAPVPERVVPTLVVVPELALVALQVHGEVHGRAGIHEGRREHGEAKTLPHHPRLLRGHVQSLRVHMGQPVVEGVPHPDLLVPAAAQDPDLSPNIELGNGDLLQADAQLLDPPLRLRGLREAADQAVRAQAGPEAVTQVGEQVLLRRGRETPVSGQNFAGDLGLLQRAEVFDAGEVQAQRIRELDPLSAVAPRLPVQERARVGWQGPSSPAVLQEPLQPRGVRFIVQVFLFVCFSFAIQAALSVLTRRGRLFAGGEPEQ